MLTPSDIDKLKGMRGFLAVHHFDKEALQPLDDAIRLVANHLTINGMTNKE